MTHNGLQPRGSRREVRNPLLALPAFQQLQNLPGPIREKLRSALWNLHTEANTRADYSWRKSKAPMASYWKAVATYAKHTAKMLQ